MEDLRGDGLISLLRGRKDRILLSNKKSVSISENEYQHYVDRHVAGEERMGIYPILDDDKVNFAVIDIDSHNNRSDTAKANEISLELIKRLNDSGIISYREVSKRGYGNYHLWILLKEPVPAESVRKALKSVVDELEKKCQDAGVRIEVFPKQDKLSGGIGNAVWLPLFPPDMKENRTVFVDINGESTNPVFIQNDPESLLRLVSSVTSKKEETRSVTLEQPISVNWVSQILSEELTEGNRNESLTRLAGYLHSKQLPLDIVEAILQLKNSTLKHPLGEREIKTIAKSISKYPIRTSEVQESVEMKFITADALLARDFPEAVDLVQGLIRKQSLVFLAGETGCGKSLLAMNLALAVASGDSKFLGYDLNGDGNVLYVNAELYPSDYKLRIEKMVQTGNHASGVKKLLITESLGETNRLFENLFQQAMEFKPSLVVVDPLYFVHNKDEKDNTDMKEIIRKLLSLRDEVKTCVFVLHHLRKGIPGERFNTDLMRGAGVLGHAADTVLLFGRSKKDKSQRVLIPAKLRHGIDADLNARLLSLDGKSLWFSDIGEADEKDYLYDPQGHDGLKSVIKACFGDQSQLKREEILKSYREQAGESLKEVSDKTIDRELSRMVKSGELKKVGHGRFSLNDRKTPNITDVQMSISLPSP